MRQSIIDLLGVPEAKINELLRLLEEMGISYELDGWTQDEVAEHIHVIKQGISELKEGNLR